MKNDLCLWVLRFGVWPKVTSGGVGSNSSAPMSTAEPIVRGLPSRSLSPMPKSDPPLSIVGEPKAWWKRLVSANTGNAVWLLLTDPTLETLPPPPSSILS